MEAFQTFQYNGRLLQLFPYESESSAHPKKTSGLRAPGAGKFEIGPIQLSVPAAEITAGEEFTLTAEIHGKNIAYVYTEVLLHDKSLNQFYGPVAREYVHAERDKETGGVNHPVWDDPINVAVRLRPSLRLLTDGVNSAFGFFVPAGYNSSDYLLDGLYTPANGTAQQRARITFNGAGETTGVVVYKEHGHRVSPHELTFHQGDQFIPFVEILTESSDEKEPWQVKDGLSTPLTFQGQPLRCETEPLMPGDYLAGLVVQDFDGCFARKYTPLTVR